MSKEIPGIGLGTWMSPEEELYAAVKYALECGYKHIDCAPIYGNQIAIGKAITECLSKKIITREALWVTSKLWNSFHAPEDVEGALKDTLSELKLDHLDLFLIHWPIAFKKEVGLNRPSDANDFISLNSIPLTETWQAMQEVVKKGLCTHIGVSNFSKNKIKEIIKFSGDTPYANQVECHPFFAQDQLLEYCIDHDIRLTAYSPLGSGGKDNIFIDDSAPSVLENQVICDIAKKHNATPAQIVLAWQLTRKVVVIPKSITPKRIKENLETYEVKLTRGDIQQINQLNMDYRYFDGSFFNLKGTPYSVESIWE